MTAAANRMSVLEPVCGVVSACGSGVAVGSTEGAVVGTAAVGAAAVAASSIVGVVTGTNVFVGLAVGIAVEGVVGSLVGVEMAMVAVGSTAAPPPFFSKEYPPMANNPSRSTPSRTKAAITKGLRLLPGCSIRANIANPLLTHTYASNLL